MNLQQRTKADRAKQPVHTSYFRRTEAFEMRQNENKIYQHCYEIIGVGRVLYGVDIYQYYFNSIYSKKYQKQITNNYQLKNLQALNNNHLSILFQTFYKLYILRSFPGLSAKQTTAEGSICDDMINKDKKYQKDQNKPDRQRKPDRLIQDSLLYSWIKHQFQYLYNSFKKQISVNVTPENYIDQARKMENMTKQVLKQLYDKLQDSNMVQQLREQQQLPQRMSTIAVIYYIKSNFQAICNNKILKKNRKKDVFSQYYSIIRKYMSIRMNLTNQTVTETNPNINKNLIYLPKYSEELYPCLNKVFILLNKLHEQQSSEKDAVLNQIIRDIITFSSNYNKKTRQFYPNLSIDYIYLDQKQMKSLASYEPLLIDVIGLRKNVKNTQLRLATQPTPNGINHEQSWLQMDEQKRILMDRRYFIPRDEMRILEEDEDNNLFFQELKATQQIHVWRLINIFYYIKNRSYFGVDYYYGKFEGSLQKKKQMKTRPFYKNQYEQSLKEADKYLRTKKLTLAQVLPIQEQYQIKGIQHPQDFEQFNLTLQNLKLHFGIFEDDDSLLQDLKYIKMKNYLYERYLLTKEITALFSHDKAFKKMPNPKKYFILSFMNMFEELHFWIEIIKTARNLQQEQGINQSSMNQSNKEKKINSPKIYQSLINDIGKQQIFGVNLLDQSAKRKRFYRDFLAKLQEYQGRQGYTQYMNKNQNFYQAALSFLKYYQSITLNIQIIAQLQAENLKDIAQLNLFLQRFKKNPIQNEIKIKQLSNLIEKLKKEFQPNQLPKVTTTLDQKYEAYSKLRALFLQIIELSLTFLQKKVKNTLQRFYSYEIQNDLLRDYQVYHKALDFKRLSDEKPTQRDLKLCAYFNKKLKYLMRILFQLSKSNLSIYLAAYKFRLIEGKSMQAKISKKKPEAMELEQLKAQIFYLEEIFKNRLQQ